jgi:formylglycine-generating enzyme required for sulfatase activity
MVPPGATNCVRCGERFTADKTYPQAGRPSNATIAIQRCVTCGEIIEDQKAYCKACGTPVYSLTETDNASVQPPASPGPLPSVIQQDSPVEVQDPFYMQPTEPIQMPPVQGQQSPPPVADWPGEASQNQGFSRTEVYQSAKPQAAQPEPNSTVAFKSDPSTVPVEAQGTQNDLSEILAQTIEYSAFTPPPANEQPPTQEISEYEAGTTPVLSAKDLQAEPDVFDLLSTNRENVQPFPVDVGEGRPAGGDQPEFRFEFTPAESEPLTGTELNSKGPLADNPADQSATQHLQFDQLPFESTVRENTGSLNQGRSTEKLSLPETAFAAKDWQEALPPPESLPPPAEAKAETPEQPEAIKPRLAQPAEVKQAQETPQVPAQPSSPPVAAWPETPQASPWPENPQVATHPAVRKKSGSPIMLIVAAVLIIGAAAAFIVWRVILHTPAIPPNTSTTANTNTATANTNTSTATANTNTSTTPAVPEGMVLVVAGNYAIGSDDGDEVEKPKHTVSLKAFFIDRTEVTNAEYKTFVDATGHAAPPHWKNGAFPDGQANFPVVQVSWQDAVDFAKWAGKRLPTEVEWEAAARGLEGRKYPWGNEWKANFANIEAGSIQEVGKFAAGASPNGALDLIGNVWEWTADPFALYAGSPAKMPDDMDQTHNYRVIRGGAYDVQRKKVNIDSSYRGYIEENRKDLTKTGFRCVKDANQ